MDGAQSVLSNISVLKKVYVPREIFTVAIVISNFIHLLLGLVILEIYLFIVFALTGFHTSPFSQMVWVVPILLVILFILVLGLSMLFAALNVFYEDVKYVLSILLWMFFFANPIFYFEETIFYKFLALGPKGPMYYKIWTLNPIADLSSSFRVSLVAPGTVQVPIDGVMTPVKMFGLSWPHIGYSAVVSVVVALATME